MAQHFEYGWREHRKLPEYPEKSSSVFSIILVQGETPDAFSDSKEVLAAMHGLIPSLTGVYPTSAWVSGPMMCRRGPPAIKAETSLP